MSSRETDSFTLRDAWNKLDGLTSLEAKHRYVEALLRVAVEVKLSLFNHRFNIFNVISIQPYLGIQETC